MTKHTEEPWRTRSEHGAAASSVEQAKPHGAKIGVIYSAWDAERIVACVNACAGIPTDKLTAFVSVYAPGADDEAIDILMRQEAWAKLRGEG